MKFYTEEGKKALWERNQILYAEIASQYLCQSLPMREKCKGCEFDCRMREEARR